MDGMCGRYASSRAPGDLADLFDAHLDPARVLGPSWNVAPTDEVWAVLERAARDTGEVQRRLRPVRWGLVPSWAKDPTVGSRMINARVETVHEKPAYRRALAKRRCLLPADGFYEWVTVPATGPAKAYKQPYFIRPESGSVMAMAGLYEFWRDPSVTDEDDPAAWLTTATIITTEATDAAGRAHPGCRSPSTRATTAPGSTLAPGHRGHPGPSPPPAGGRLAVTAVSTAVNSVRNDGPHLLDDPGRGPRDPDA